MTADLRRFFSLNYVFIRILKMNTAQGTKLYGFKKSLNSTISDVQTVMTLPPSSSQRTSYPALMLTDIIQA